MIGVALSYKVQKKIEVFIKEPNSGVKFPISRFSLTRRYSRPRESVFFFVLIISTFISNEIT